VGWVDNGARARDRVCSVRERRVFGVRDDARRLELSMVNERIVERGSILVTGSCRIKYDPGRDGVVDEPLHTYPECRAIR
jgi:hypothetical protein